MSERKPSFTYANYIVCCYCSHLVRAAGRDDYLHGCGLVKNDQGQYKAISLSRKYGIYGLIGCDRFNASGLPAHPDVKRDLIKQNPKTISIPEDPNATETSWDFEDKIGRYPHREIPLYIHEENCSPRLTIE